MLLGLFSMLLGLFSMLLIAYSLFSILPNSSQCSIAHKNYHFSIELPSDFITIQCAKTIILNWIGFPYAVALLVGNNCRTGKGISSSLVLTVYHFLINNYEY